MSRRRAPRFSGFNQLATHPVLVGMAENVVAPAPEDDGVRVHHMEGHQGGLRRGVYDELAVGSMLPRERRQNIQPPSAPAGSGGWVASGASPSGARAPITGGGAFGGRGGFGGRSYFPYYEFYPYGSGPYPYWYYPSYYAGYYPWGLEARQGMPGRADCAPPISADCRVLTITKRWAIVCFMWAYNRAREQYGTDLGRIVDGILRESAPCDLSDSEASLELRRRLRLASAVMLRGEGLDIALPTPPNATRPPDVARYKQPWIRALMTGWV